MAVPGEKSENAVDEAIKYGCCKMGSNLSKTRV